MLSKVSPVFTDSCCPYISVMIALALGRMIFGMQNRGSLVKWTSSVSTNLLRSYFDLLYYFLGGIQCSSVLSNDKQEVRFQMSFRVGNLIWVWEAEATDQAPFYRFYSSALFLTMNHWFPRYLPRKGETRYRLNLPTPSPLLKEKISVQLTQIPIEKTKTYGLNDFDKRNRLGTKGNKTRFRVHLSIPKWIEFVNFITILLLFLTAPLCLVISRARFIPF